MALCVGGGGGDEEEGVTSLLQEYEWAGDLSVRQSGGRKAFWMARLPLLQRLVHKTSTFSAKLCAYLIVMRSQNWL